MHPREVIAPRKATLWVAQRADESLLVVDVYIAMSGSLPQQLHLLTGMVEARSRDKQERSGHLHRHNFCIKYIKHICTYMYNVGQIVSF